MQNLDDIDDVPAPVPNKKKELKKEPKKEPKNYYTDTLAWNKRNSIQNKKECKCFKCEENAKNSAIMAAAMTMIDKEETKEAKPKPLPPPLKIVIGGDSFRTRPKLFTPENLHAFMYQGKVPKVEVLLDKLNKTEPALEENLQEVSWGKELPCEKIKMIQVTGCGRSGTTLVFNLLQELLGDPLVALDEPRLLYCLNPIGRRNFGESYEYWPCCTTDCWSVLAKKESHRVRKSLANHCVNNLYPEYLKHYLQPMLNHYHGLLRPILVSEAQHFQGEIPLYLEKMPENFLKPPFLQELTKIADLTVVEVERCWVDVALSISKFCLQDWYGFNQIKYPKILDFHLQVLYKQFQEENLDKVFQQFVLGQLNSKQVREGTHCTKFAMFRKGLLEWLAFQLVKDHHKEDAAYRRVSVRYEHLAEGQAAELLEPVFKAAGREMKGQPTTAVRPLNKAAFEERNSRLKAVMQGAAPSGELEQHVFDIFANEKTRIFTPGSKQYDVFLNGL